MHTTKTNPVDNTIIRLALRSLFDNDQLSDEFYDRATAIFNEAVESRLEREREALAGLYEETIAKLLQDKLIAEEAANLSMTQRGWVGRSTGRHFHAHPALRRTWHSNHIVIYPGTESTA